MAANCQACSAPIKANTKFCTGCGTHISATQLIEPAHQTIPDTSLASCQICSGRNAVAVRFCRHCGAAMDFAAVGLVQSNLTSEPTCNVSDEAKPLFSRLAIPLLISGVMLASIGGAAWVNRYEWLGFGGTTNIVAVATASETSAARSVPKGGQVQRFVVADANVRNRPTAQGSSIVSKIPRGTLVSGLLQVGLDGVSQWLKLNNGVGFVGAINLSNSAPPKLANSFGDLEWSVEVDTDLLAAPASDSAVAKRVKANEYVQISGITENGYAETKLNQGGVGYFLITAANDRSGSLSRAEGSGVSNIVGNSSIKLASRFDPEFNAFLAKYAMEGESRSDFEEAPKVAGARIGDTKYRVAYLSYYTWCGSGGCRPLIFEKTAAGFRFVSLLGVSKLPIRQIPNVRRGVPSIAILSYRPPLKGDTWLTEYGIVQFNGKGWSESWPGNIVANPGGTVLLSYDDLKPLWK